MKPLETRLNEVSFDWEAEADSLNKPLWKTFIRNLMSMVSGSIRGK